jgi:hypothetical protein
VAPLKHYDHSGTSLARRRANVGALDLPDTNSGAIASGQPALGDRRQRYVMKEQV